VSSPRKVSRAAARRFLRRAHLLDSPAADVGAVVAHLGFIQIDPINVCGRMHDLILRNRVQGYREGGLMRALHGEAASLDPSARTIFEHHLPSTHNLSALPVEAWPHLQAAMRARARKSSAWSGRLTPREKVLAARVMERLAAGGPVAPEDFAAEGPARRSVWNTATLAKSALQKLYFHGRLLIVGRENNRRLYDLPERVLPPEVLGRREHAPAETARWLAHLHLLQHRLTTLKRAELPLVEDLVEAVHVEGCPKLFGLRSDLAIWEGADEARSDEETLLLAPLDPMIYHRPLTRALWDFDYNWEVYVPEAKRKRGYYALPVLAGLELVGHVDPKADREKKRLRVMSRSLKRGHKASHPVGRLAAFLGLRAS